MTRMDMLIERTVVAQMLYHVIYQGREDLLYGHDLVLKAA